MFRDLATISLLLAVVTAVLSLFRLAPSGTMYGVSLFGVQYLAAGLAARNYGVRLVTNVLAIHSCERRG